MKTFKIVLNLALGLSAACVAGWGISQTSNPAPLDNISSKPNPTTADPDPGKPPLISTAVALINGAAAPTNLSNYVADEAALLRLGKALFWDMQLGSDGVTACATCHFKAGADNRSKNQVSPGFARVQKLQNTFVVAAGDRLFGNCLEDSNNPLASSLGSCAVNTTPSVTNSVNSYVGFTGVPNNPRYATSNYQLTVDDFPFFKLTDPTRRASSNNSVTQNLNDIVSSQGVFKSTLIKTVAGQAADDVTYTADPDGFSINSINVRRVEPRNTPTVINAVFNKLQFWDGRARERFNGVDESGVSPAPQGARLMFAKIPGTPSLVDISIDNSSLASLVTGPSQSIFEMSAEGRNLHQIGGKFLSRTGKKMHSLVALGKQVVDPADSVLGSLSKSPKPGLESSYMGMIQSAFNRTWWNSTYVVQVKSDGSFEKFIFSPKGSLAENQFTQAEYNFSLFMGLAMQKYIATLVSDQTPFDKFQAGDISALTDQERKGLEIYVKTSANGGGNCNTCHTIPETTRASVRRAQGVNTSDADILINNGDFGFSNNYGIRPAVDDPGAEAVNLLAPPRCGVSPLPACPNPYINSKFKMPSLRNVALTAPYFHNGGNSTLEQVVDFYARGRGDAGTPAAATLPMLLPTTTALPVAVTVNGSSTLTGLDDGSNKAALLAFIRNGLTDPRVLYERAPFDHPQIFVPNGHPVATSGSTTPIWSGNKNGAKIATDAMVEIKAVGKSGVTVPQANFLGLP